MGANVYQTLASLRITLVPNRRISTTHAPADHLHRPPNTKHHVLETNNATHSPTLVPNYSLTCPIPSVGLLDLSPPLVTALLNLEVDVHTVL